MSIDPGGKTGMAWGWFNDEADSVGSALARARRKKALYGCEISGEPHHQAILIADVWSNFKFRSNVELGLRLDDIHLVVERFDVRQRNFDPAAILIIGGMNALLSQPERGFGIGVKITKKTDENFSFVVCGPNPEAPQTTMPSFQMPSTAMTYATSQRLKEWDAWVVGSEHIRDAMRHLAAKLSEELD